jgi:NitT/TauT family transport system substrate-binding protein
MMMSRGEIDASWAVEPWGSRLVADAGAKLIAEEKDLWPEHRFTLTLVVVSPEFLKDHPDTVEAVLRVHRDWTDKLSRDPAAQVDALVAALAKLTGQKLPKGVIESSLSHVSFTDEPLAESIKTFAQRAVELGVARSAPSVSGLVDTRALERARGQQPPRSPGAPTISPPPASPAAPAGGPPR